MCSEPTEALPQKFDIRLGKLIIKVVDQFFECSGDYCGIARCGKFSAGIAVNRILEFEDLETNLPVDESQNRSYLLEANSGVMYRSIFVSGSEFQAVEGSV